MLPKYCRTLSASRPTQQGVLCISPPLRQRVLQSVVPVAPPGPKRQRAFARSTPLAKADVKVKSATDLETFLSSTAGQLLLSQHPDVANEEGEDTVSERDDDMVDLAVGGQTQSGQRHRKLQARGRARIQQAMTLMTKHAGQLEKCLGTDLPIYLELGMIGEQSLRQCVERMLSLCDRRVYL